LLKYRRTAELRHLIHLHLKSVKVVRLHCHHHHRRYLLFQRLRFLKLKNQRRRHLNRLPLHLRRLLYHHHRHHRKLSYQL
jgi:hypothetical protein